MNYRLKYFFTFILIAFIYSVSSAQTKNDATPIVLTGKWDVVTKDKSVKISQYLLDKMKGDSSLGNHNLAIYEFHGDSQFSLSSIRDYSLSDEKGVYELNEEQNQLIRHVNFPNKMRNEKRSHVIKSKILYYDQSYMVLKSNRYIVYLHKIGKL